MNVNVCVLQAHMPEQSDGFQYLEDESEERLKDSPLSPLKLTNLQYQSGSLKSSEAKDGEY